MIDRWDQRIGTGLGLSLQGLQGLSSACQGNEINLGNTSGRRCVPGTVWSRSRLRETDEWLGPIARV